MSGGSDEGKGSTSRSEISRDQASEASNKCAYLMHECVQTHRASSWYVLVDLSLARRIKTLNPGREHLKAYEVM